MNARTQRRIAVAGTLAALLGSASCGNVVRQGRSPSMLVIDTLQAASGAKPGALSGFLNSDVITLVTASVGGVSQQVPTIFNDIGLVQLHIVLKDQGSVVAPTIPSALNAVTVTRYHVEFIRSDGRNTQGVDVPYAFDGATTGTITSTPSSLGFELVRHEAKEEAPLKALAGGGGRIEISTIANITFYGTDLAGNDVQVTGSITVDFSDFGDPT